MASMLWNGTAEVCSDGQTHTEDSNRLSPSYLIGTEVRQASP